MRILTGASFPAGSGGARACPSMLSVHVWSCLTSFPSPNSKERICPVIKLKELPPSAGLKHTRDSPRAWPLTPQQPLNWWQHLHTSGFSLAVMSLASSGEMTSLERSYSPLVTPIWTTFTLHVSYSHTASRTSCTLIHSRHTHTHTITTTLHISVTGHLLSLLWVTGGPDPDSALPNWICEASCRRPLIASCKPLQACCGPLPPQPEN